MISNLPPQSYNPPPKPAQAVIEPYQPSQIPISKPSQAPIAPDHFGGYITFGGTAASGVSGSIVQGYIPEFTPAEGPIPHLLIQLDHEGHLLDIKPEIQKLK